MAPNGHGCNSHQRAITVRGSTNPNFGLLINQARIGVFGVTKFKSRAACTADIERIRVVPVSVIFADLEGIQSSAASNEAVEQHHRKL